VRGIEGVRRPTKFWPASVKTAGGDRNPNLEKIRWLESDQNDWGGQGLGGVYGGRKDHVPVRMGKKTGAGTVTAPSVENRVMVNSKMGRVERSDSVMSRQSKKRKGDPPQIPKGIREGWF